MRSLKIPFFKDVYFFSVNVGIVSMVVVLRRARMLRLWLSVSCRQGEADDERLSCHGVWQVVCVCVCVCVCVVGVAKRVRGHLQTIFFHYDVSVTLFFDPLYNYLLP